MSIIHTSYLKRTKREKKSAVHINVYPYRRFRLLDVVLQLGRHLAESDHSMWRKDESLFYRHARASLRHRGTETTCWVCNVHAKELFA